MTRSPFVKVEGLTKGRRYLKGALDELFIIEGALTDDQILTIYEDNRYVPLP